MNKILGISAPVVIGAAAVGLYLYMNATAEAAVVPVPVPDPGAGDGGGEDTGGNGGNGDGGEDDGSSSSYEDPNMRDDWGAMPPDFLAPPWAERFGGGYPVASIGPGGAMRVLPWQGRGMLAGISIPQRRAFAARRAIYGR